MHGLTLVRSCRRGPILTSIWLVALLMGVSSTNSGEANGIRAPGIVQWQDAEAEAGGVDATSSEEKFRRLRDWGYPAEMLPPGELRRLEPDVDADAYGSRPIILYPQDGWCYATQYAGRVAGAACNRYNARLVIGKVARIDIAGGAHYRYDACRWHPHRS